MTFVRTLIPRFAAVAGLLCFATAAQAADPQYHEIITGNPAAKVTVQEFASVTCPHCAEFNNDDYPQLKTRYIDTGKIQFIFRDVPTAPQNLAVAGAAIARCAPEGRGRALIDMMFKNQGQWMKAPNETLRAYAQLAGMSSTEVDACLGSEKIHNEMSQAINRAFTIYKIERTPTFYVNDTKVDYANLKALSDVIDRCLAQIK